MDPPKTRFAYTPICGVGLPKMRRAIANIAYYSTLCALAVLWHTSGAVYSNDCCRVDTDITPPDWTYNTTTLSTDVLDSATMLYLLMSILVFGLVTPGAGLGSINANNTWLLPAHFAGFMVSYFIFATISRNEHDTSKALASYGPMLITVICGIGFFSQTRTVIGCETMDDTNSKRPWDCFPEDAIFNLFEVVPLMMLLAYFDTLTCFPDACTKHFEGDHIHHYQWGLLIAKCASYAEIVVKPWDCDYNPMKQRSTFQVGAFLICVLHSTSVAVTFHGLVNYGPDRMYEYSDTPKYTAGFALIFIISCLFIRIIASQVLSKRRAP